MTALRYNHGFLKTTDDEILRCLDAPLVVRSLWVCNTGGSQQTFDLEHVPADESISTQHSLYYNNRIGSKVTTVSDTPIFLLPGDVIAGRASVANEITITFYLQPYSEYLRTI